MRRRLRRLGPILLAVVAVGYVVHGQSGPPVPTYTIAFSSFGPLNADVFLADGDGGNAKPFLPSPGLDVNASLSADGQWVLFTSDRNGSADIYRAHLDGSALSRLTDDPAFDDQAALSPDGRTLAFVSSRSGNADIWLLDVASRAVRNLTQHEAGDFRPSWSPDGEWLAFSSDRDRRGMQLDFTFRHTTHVYVVKRDGSALRKLSDDDHIEGAPAWSPDGRSVLTYRAPLGEVRMLTAAATAAGTTQIVAIDMATGQARTLTTGPGAKVFPHPRPDGVVAYFDRNGDGQLGFSDGRVGLSGEFQHVSWSGDGRRMVYHRDVGREWPPFQPVPTRDQQFKLVRTGLFPNYAPDGSRLALISARLANPSVHNGITVMNSNGSSPTLLFDDPKRSALVPVWSPTGDRIAFGFGQFFPMTRGFGIADVAMFDVKERALTILTDGKTNAGFPSWSPRGDRIVFREWLETGSKLLIVDVRTKQVSTLLENFGRVNFPSWSPVSNLVQFTSDRDGNFEIYTIDVETKRISRLTNSPGNDAHAAWSPDGEWIAFSSVRLGFKDEGALHPRNPQASGDLFVMRRDGSDVRVLTDNPYEEATPGWAPLDRK